jgi:hypothetical protein
MGDEDVRKPHELARRQRIDVTDVEQQCAPLDTPSASSRSLATVTCAFSSIA